MSLGIRISWPVTFSSRFDGGFEKIFDKQIVLSVSNVKLDEQKEYLEMDLKMISNKKMIIEDVSYVSIPTKETAVEDAQHSSTTIISLGEYGMLILRYKHFNYEIYKDTQDIRKGVVSLK